MWDCLVKLSTWAEGNSGQIQIGIAFFALGLAILGYKKVLEQIEISNKQTDTTNEQIISLNNERVADLKINLLSEINKQIKQLVKLEKGYLGAGEEFRNFEFVVTQKFPEHLPMIQLAKAQYEEAFNINLPVVRFRLNELRTLANSVFHNEVDANFLENSLQLIFQRNENVNIAELEYENLLKSFSKLDNAILHRR